MNITISTIQQKMTKQQSKQQPLMGMFVPNDPDNRHYAEILKQVKEGKLTIKDAD